MVVGGMTQCCKKDSSVDSASFQGKPQPPNNCGIDRLTLCGETKDPGYLAQS